MKEIRNANRAFWSFFRVPKLFLFDNLCGRLELFSRRMLELSRRQNCSRHMQSSIGNCSSIEDTCTKCRTKSEYSRSWWNKKRKAELRWNVCVQGQQGSPNAILRTDIGPRGPSTDPRSTNWAKLNSSSLHNHCCRRNWPMRRTSCLW